MLENKEPIKYKSNALLKPSHGSLYIYRPNGKTIIINGYYYENKDKENPKVDYGNDYYSLYTNSDKKEKAKLVELLKTYKPYLYPRTLLELQEILILTDTDTSSFVSYSEKLYWMLNRKYSNDSISEKDNVGYSVSYGLNPVMFLYLYNTFPGKLRIQFVNKLPDNVPEYNPEGDNDYRQTYALKHLYLTKDRCDGWDTLLPFIPNAIRDDATRLLKTLELPFSS